MYKQYNGTNCSSKNWISFHTNYNNNNPPWNKMIEYIDNILLK